MPTKVDSFWPAGFTQTDVIPPVDLLAEQSKHLDQLTGGRLKLTWRVSQEKDGEFTHLTVVIRVPLAKFEYVLMELSFPWEYYPVTVYQLHRDAMSPSAYDGLELDAAQFNEFLKKELSSDETKRVLMGLLARAKAAEASGDSPPG